MNREPDPPTVTIALNREPVTADGVQALLPQVYEQLRATAQKFLNGERRGHTLEPTALVHEAYVKLMGPREIPWQNRGHFYAAAAQAMRRILVDHARARYGRGEIGREARRRALSISGLSGIENGDQLEGLLALDEALIRLEGVDEQAAAVVRLRFFAGLDNEQAGAALGMSARTVKRAWAFARGWLREDLERPGAP